MLNGINHSLVSFSTRCAGVITCPWHHIIIRISIFGIHFFCSWQFLWCPFRIFTICQDILRFCRNALRVITGRISFLPSNICNKTFLSKHLITEILQISLLIVINRNKDHAVVCQQVACKRQSGQHECEPSRMAGTSTTCHVKDACSTFGRDIQTHGQLISGKIEFVVIHKSIRSCVVWRVDIYNLHLAAIRLYKMLQGIQVVAAYINILAVAVLRLCVMLLVRTNERCRVHVGKHASIVLA